MAHKKRVYRVFEEIIANAIGWLAGLISVDLLKIFFIEKKWINAWGIFSKKAAVDSSTFHFLEWTLTAVFGFMVMYLINILVRKVFFKNHADLQDES
jgi:hypothetical protein